MRQITCILPERKELRRTYLHEIVGLFPTISMIRSKLKRLGPGVILTTSKPDSYFVVVSYMTKTGGLVIKTNLKESVEDFINN